MSSHQAASQVIRSCLLDTALRAHVSKQRPTADSRSATHAPNNIVSTIRLQIFGPQMKGGVTSPLLSALQRTFETQYALPHYIINVTATSAAGPAVQYVTPNGEAGACSCYIVEGLARTLPADSTKLCYASLQQRRHGCIQASADMRWVAFDHVWVYYMFVLPGS